MCKFARVIRYTVLSQHFHFCCFRAMAYDCETECSFRLFKISCLLPFQTYRRLLFKFWPKTVTSRFEPPFGGQAQRTLFILGHWKAHSRLSIHVNWTFSARCNGWGASSKYSFEIIDVKTFLRLLFLSSFLRFYVCFIFVTFLYTMLSYRRETALQGAL